MSEAFRCNFLHIDVYSLLVVEDLELAVSSLTLCSYSVELWSLLGSRFHDRGISCLSLAAPDKYSSGFYPSSDHVGFEMDKVVLGSVLTEDFGFHCCYYVGLTTLAYSFLII
jgi:hypothetical protein